jgi:hypothetical protein
MSLIPVLEGGQSSAGPFEGGGCPVSVSAPSKNVRGAERRQALVRIAAPRGAPCGRAHLRIAGDHRPMTRAGAPLDALLRRFPSGIGPRFPAAFAPPISQLLAGDRSVPGLVPVSKEIKHLVCQTRLSDRREFKLK